MGSSLAAGYVTPQGNITTWLNELAFVPVDYREDAPVDEWSGDRGVGVQYFSQQAVGRLLAPAASICPREMPLPVKLEQVQKLMAAGDARARRIYETIGVYFGYTIATYADFYELRNLLVLGRVMTGEGGDLILSVAQRGAARGISRRWPSASAFTFPARRRSGTARPSPRPACPPFTHQENDACNFITPPRTFSSPMALAPEAALARTTHLCISAHQDDIEIMAYHGIAECFGRKDRWFTGVVVTNGAGSPRSGIYGDYTDEEMQKVRVMEQRKAAFVGEYACQIQLGFTSARGEGCRPNPRWWRTWPRFCAPRGRRSCTCTTWPTSTIRTSP